MGSPAAAASRPASLRRVEERSMLDGVVGEREMDIWENDPRRKNAWG
jgi:hypothetical protein